jgi:hypothetical protein
MMLFCSASSLGGSLSVRPFGPDATLPQPATRPAVTMDSNARQQRMTPHPAYNTRIVGVFPFADNGAFSTRRGNRRLTPPTPGLH